MSYIFSEKEDAKSPLEAGSVWFCGAGKGVDPSHREKHKEKSAGSEQKNFPTTRSVY